MVVSLPQHSDEQHSDERQADPQASGPVWQMVVIFLLTILILILCFVLALPFLPAITWAIALTVATRTPYDWLSRHIRRPSLTAAIGVLLVIVLVVVPATFLAQHLGKQILWVASLVQSGAAQNWITGSIDTHPWLASLIEQATDLVNVRQAAEKAAGFVAARLQDLLTGSVTTITQIVLMLFTLFFLFRDRDHAVEALRSILPLNRAQSDHLLDRMSNTILATVQGSLTIAAIQGCLGGIMFWILGVPNAVVWSVVMAMLATIPSLGTFLVWMPVAVFLALTGHWIKAGILVGWGMFVIGTVDNLLYPTLVGSKLQLHTVPVLFAVLGGIGLFGISGIVLGPLILTTAVTLLRFWSPEALPDEKSSNIIETTDETPVNPVS